MCVLFQEYQVGQIEPFTVKHKMTGWNNWVVYQHRKNNTISIYDKTKMKQNIIIAAKNKKSKKMCSNLNDIVVGKRCYGDMNSVLAISNKNQYAKR